MVRAGMPPRPRPRLGEPLTARELEVLHVLIDGQTVRAAADVMGITQQTLKNHIGAIHLKTDQHSLVGVYYRLGWLRPPYLPTQPEVCLACGEEDNFVTDTHGSYCNSCKTPKR
jgi:DNA-binding CsgD family transcriptional regulator